jgi:DNA-binding CsgD family transcriptional regulator
MRLNDLGRGEVVDSFTRGTGSGPAHPVRSGIIEPPDVQRPDAAPDPGRLQAARSGLPRPSQVSADSVRNHSTSRSSVSLPSSVRIRERLTAQELKVATLARQGLTNKEVGAELSLAPTTINFHLRAVFRKLDIRRRTELHDALDQYYASTTTATTQA